MRLLHFSSSINSFFSHPMGLDVWILVGPIVYFLALCVWTAKALVRLHGCAGSPEPSLVAYVISTIISWAGSYHHMLDSNIVLPQKAFSYAWVQCRVRTMSLNVNLSKFSITIQNEANCLLNNCTSHAWCNHQLFVLLRSWHSQILSYPTIYIIATEIAGNYLFPWKDANWLTCSIIYMEVIGENIKNIK